MSHPTNKKEALIPLKFMKKPSTPNKFFENGLPPPKNNQYGVYPP